MAANLKVCWDRISRQDELRPRVVRPGRGRHGPTRAIIEFRKMWVNGTKLRVFFMDGTPEQHAVVKREAVWWLPYANISLEFTNDPKSEVRITFDENDGAWSYIGTEIQRHAFNEPTMNLGFLDPGTAAHEFGHTLGLGHEHQSPMGGIEWNVPVVLSDAAKSPNFWSAAVARHNIIDKYNQTEIHGTQFDPDSIMLYEFPGTWVKSGQATHGNSTLSTMDKEFIGGGQGYPFEAKSKPTVLRVNAPTAKAAAIGMPGEEDLFSFKVRSAGRYVVRTSGKTNLYMQLFGPDSQTQLIKEDDDSGVGTNARIIADLLPGEYFAQVRHSDKATGKGAYKIAVDKGKR